MNEIKKSLKAYGLDNQEIDVYLNLLSTIESSAYKIAKELRIPRSTVYNKLESLKEKGLIASSRINNVKHYTPKSLNSFIYKLNEKRVLIENILPQLKDISKNARLEKPKTYLYHGKEKMKRVWEEMLETYKNEKIEQLYATSHSNLINIFPKYFLDWTQRRIKIGVQSNIIVKKDDKLKVDENTEKRTFRFVDNEYISESSLVTYGNKTSIFVLNKTEPKTIVIESKEVADMFNKLLKFMWDHSK